MRETIVVRIMMATIANLRRVHGCKSNVQTACDSSGQIASQFVITLIIVLFFWVSVIGCMKLTAVRVEMRGASVDHSKDDRAHLHVLCGGELVSLRIGGNHAHDLALAGRAVVSGRGATTRRTLSEGAAWGTAHG